MLSMAQNVYYGLSLGSVLLLAAIGLAITFGVMGVINMAHGEMVMIGAYTTFVVPGGDPPECALAVRRLAADRRSRLAFLVVAAVSASPSSAASSDFSTAGRSRPCWRPGASA